jgi:hypothetical protein
VHTADHADLRHALSGKLVEVKGRLIVVDECPVGEDAVEVFLGLGIDPVVVRIRLRREVDVRPTDVQEGEGIAGREGGSLGAIDDVVRRRDDPFDQIGSRTPRAKWAEADTPSKGCNAV